MKETWGVEGEGRPGGGGGAEHLLAMYPFKQRKTEAVKKKSAPDEDLKHQRTPPMFQ